MSTINPYPVILQRYTVEDPALSRSEIVGDYVVEILLFGVDDATPWWESSRNPCGGCGGTRKRRNLHGTEYTW